MTNLQLFTARLSNILNQLDKCQQKELFEGEIKDLNTLNLEEIFKLHSRFIDLQYSATPLTGKDIRHVVLYPYRGE